MSTEAEYYFVEKPLFDVVCPVMKSVMLEPHQTHCCGNHLSAKASTTLQEEGKNCPLCKKAHFTSSADGYFRRKVGELQVYCPHRRKGCEWMGELSTMNCHTVSCPQKSGPLNLCKELQERKKVRKIQLERRHGNETEREKGRGRGVEGYGEGTRFMTFLTLCPLASP